MSDLLRVCGKCGDLHGIDKVKCDNCGTLLVLTVPARVEARHGKRAAA
jgi:rRNA maturation protein Nop10